MRIQLIYKSVLCAALLMGLSACSDEDVVSGGRDYYGDPVDEIQITGIVRQHSQTRANDGGFVDQDAIGVYIVDYDGDVSGELLSQGNRVTNMRFTYDASTSLWAGTSKIYWKDKNTPVDAFSYYPFREVVEAPKAMPVQVLPRQDKPDEKTGFSNYEASDLLWAKAEKVESGQRVNLEFRHMMAGVDIRLLPGEGFADTVWTKLEKSVIIRNVVSHALLDLSTGVMTNLSDSVCNVVPADKDVNYRAVILPQSKVEGSVLFDITVDGQSYQFKRAEDFTFLPHKLHKFTIQVTQRLPEGDYEFTLIDEAITAWEDDGISHGGDSREYIVVHSPEKGKLGEVLEASGYDLKQIYNLKIVGEMTGSDFEYIRNNLTYLEAINLKEVRLRECEWAESWHDGTQAEDDVLPKNAFYCHQSLKHLVFPDKLKKIGEAAFRGAGLVGALDIPEGVTHIGGGAFNNWDSYEGAHLFLTSLKLPHSLEYIGGWAFRNNKFNNELSIPENVTYIGDNAFCECNYMYGEFHLPSGLQTLENDAFSGVKFSGKMIIPAGIKKIAGLSRTNCTSVRLPEGLEIIGENALGGIGYKGQFETHSSKIRGELYVPSTVHTIGRGAFAGLQISHVHLPEGLTEIPRDLFRGCDKLIDTLKIPSSVMQIRSGAFSNCSRLTAIILPENLEQIGGDNSDCSWLQFSTFGGCNSLNLIRCEAKIPPALIGGVFDGLPKDNFTLEVPEGSVELYRNAEGWREFKRISAHNNFVCRPQFVNLLNKGHQRKVVLNAEGNWTVDYLPSWCSISATSGFKKTELTITIDDLPDGQGTRQDSIVFKLTDKDAIACYYVKQYDSEYKEDDSYSLQTASRGKGIDLVIVGDGYDAADIAGDTYLNDMRQAMEHFFGVEPYTSYRDYFNVHTAFALSDDSGLGTLNTLRNPKFGTVIEADRLQVNFDYAMQYAVENADVQDKNSNNLTVIVLANTEMYEGICYMYSNGAAVAVCTKSVAEYPNDARGVLQHEAGGHAFGKFADEYMYHRAWIQTCPCSCCKHLDELRIDQALGWGQNLCISGKYKDVPWYHLIHDARYNDIVDIYEGGYYHTNGVYRSEYNSVMNNNVPYFSTWCRELIVRRIKELAGESFDYEDFVINDSREWGRDFTIESRAPGRLPLLDIPHRGNSPVILNRPPKLNNK